ARRAPPCAGRRRGTRVTVSAVITLSLAARMTAAALARADELGALVSAAVVKAFTAVAHRIATADLAEAAAPGGPLAGLASSGGGRYVVFGGGLPCWA